MNTFGNVNFNETLFNFDGTVHVNSGLQILGRIELNVTETLELIGLFVLN